LLQRHRCCETRLNTWCGVVEVVGDGDPGRWLRTDWQRKDRGETEMTMESDRWLSGAVTAGNNVVEEV
jgi:hypothetical protein